MGRSIIKLQHEGVDYFMEWSSVVDAPVTYGLTWDEFKEHYKEEYGKSGFQELPDRMQRVNARGHSSRLGNESVEEFLEYNRAGDNEECLTVREIIDKYIVNSPLRQPKKE